MTWREQHQLIHDLLFCSTSPYVVSITPNRCSSQVRRACVKALRQVISGSSLFCKPAVQTPSSSSSSSCPLPSTAAGRNARCCKRYQAEPYYNADHENCGAVDQHPKSNNNAAKNLKLRLFCFSTFYGDFVLAPLMSRFFGKRNVHAWDHSPTPLIISKSFSTGEQQVLYFYTLLIRPSDSMYSVDFYNMAFCSWLTGRQQNFHSLYLNKKVL